MTHKYPQLIALLGLMLINEAGAAQSVTVAPGRNAIHSTAGTIAVTNPQPFAARADTALKVFSH